MSGDHGTAERLGPDGRHDRAQRAARARWARWQPRTIGELLAATPATARGWLGRAYPHIHAPSFLSIARRRVLVECSVEPGYPMQAYLQQLAEMCGHDVQSGPS